MSHDLAKRPLRRALRRVAPRPAAAMAACLCLLAAATAVQADTPSSAANRAAPPAPAAAKTTSNWQSAPSKHGGSGVVLRFAVPDKIAVGETVTLRLQFLGVSAPDGATVEVRDRSTRATVLSLNLTAGEPRTVELPYSSRSDGMQFLDVVTTQGGRLSVQSIALHVGSGQLNLKPQGQRATTADGQAVISLPAASPGASR